MRQLRRKRETQKGIKIAVIASASVIAILIIAYFVMAFYFKNHFFFRTTINGLGVGGMTMEEAEEKIATDVGEYLLTVYDREEHKYHLMGKDIGNSYVPDGSVGKALEEQKYLNWLKPVFGGNAIDVDTPMKYDADMLRQAVGSMECFIPENIVDPVNADIQLVDGTYQIVPEVPGSKMILDKAVEEIGKAVTEGEGEVTLTDAVYEGPELTKESPQITDTMNTLQKYLNAKVVYKIADYDESFGQDQIEEMIQLNDDFSITFDEKKITDFVQSMASKYNTYGDARDFKTSSGDTVKIGGGDYGWVINKDAEAEMLLENIKSGETVEREPVYSQRAKVEGLNDIGNTYVEIDYTKQHMWYYEEGQLKMESDIVSGNIARNNGSPDGVYKIVYKQSPAVLKGEDYESNVDYFMVFAYNVGIHDADWRTEFGGQFYKTSGSHGCINAPQQVAEDLYAILKADTPVIAYYREKVELTAENCKISNAYSYVNPEKNKEGNGETPNE